MMIQKFIRGYLEYNKVKATLGKIKMKQCFEYFNEMRNELIHQKTVFLQVHIKRFLKKRRLEIKRFEERNNCMSIGIRA